MEHLNIHVKDSDFAKSTPTREEPFRMQTIKEEALANLAASPPTTPAKGSSAEQHYPSPAYSPITTDAPAPVKKRAAEDDLYSCPHKKVLIQPSGHKIAGSFGRNVRDQLLQDNLAAKIKLDEAKKSDSAADAVKHLSNIDPYRPLDCRIDPRSLWDEKSFNLGQYPRLVTTKLTYRYKQLKNPWYDAWEYYCFPIAPADDIEKTLHLGRATKHLKWTGFWAEQKLQKEIAKYERIKEFWLFNYSVYSMGPFFAGFDNKEEFCAGGFLKELQSPWVCAWLREFLGEEVMDGIETAMKNMDEAQWKTASNSLLRNKSDWETLCLRFKCHESPV